MSVSLDKIVTQTNSKIVSGGQDAINTARLAGSVEALETRYSVANLAALPPAVQNTGRFIYVEDIAAYRYSDGTQWTNDYNTTCVAITSCQIFAWGESFCGAVGDGTTLDRCSPVREICSATNWCQVSSRGFGSAAVNNSGQVWGWGDNRCGTAGNGTTTSICSPVREFCSATDWCQVVNGTAHTLAIKTSGQLWAWGSNAISQLGDGTIVPKCSPVRERCSATDWCGVSAGRDFTVAIKTSGQIWGWGDNRCGPVGDGTLQVRCSPVREFCSATDWCRVSAGRKHTSALKTSGQLWSWGVATGGLLGDGTTVIKCSPVREISSSTDWCQVSAGGEHTAAIKTTGQLWSWGCNFLGELGAGTAGFTQRCSPVREFCSATDWCQVSAGNNHSLAIKTTGQLWAWGGGVGVLGTGTVTTRCSPVREITSSTNWNQVSASFERDRSTAIKIVTSKGFNEP